MDDFIQLCEDNTVESSLKILNQKYSVEECEKFRDRLCKNEKFIFVDDNKETNVDIVDKPTKVKILTLNITRKCNLKCSYCFESSEYRKKSDMPFEVAQRAIDTFFTNASSDWVIIFTGGEPLLNYDLICRVVEYVNEKKLKVEYRIKTNSVLLNEAMMGYLIKNNFKIQVSLDGDKKAHNTHRKFADGRGTFDIVDSKIRNLLKSNYGNNVTISGTVTHQTIKYIDDSYVQLNSYNNIAHYDLKSVMPNVNDQYALSDKDYKKAFVSNIKNSKYVYEKSTCLNWVWYKNICGIGLWNITIDVDGKIYPCYRMCGSDEFVIGDIYSLILPIKLPNRLKEVYRMENKKNCSKCALIHICKMGCYTDKLMYNMENNEECSMPIKRIINNVFQEELIDNGMYKYLEII